MRPTIVAYLYSKFDFIEVIVPALAMSAGTMLSLAPTKSSWGGKVSSVQSIPRCPSGRSVSARAVVDHLRQRSEK